MLVFSTALSILVTSLPPSSALDNGLALTPPMGWLSWLWLGCNTDCDKNPDECLSEDVIKRITDRMASDGFREAGYEYVIIDDCWLENKRKNGKMVPDRKRFKSGMKDLSEYIHSKGLKFGMYQDIGTKTCAGAPGMRDHEKEDITTFDEWEIDYLKVDGCYEEPEHMNQSYPALEKLLNNTGHPILYSCSWPAYVPGKNKDYQAMKENCNIWRNYDDIEATWSSLLDIMDWFGSQPELAHTAGPGHYHDPDMLVIGNSPITLEQAFAQLAVWSILAAPLLLSADLGNLTADEKRILLNPDIIAIDQCQNCRMGQKLSSSGDGLDIWKRTLLGYDTAIVLLNREAKQNTFVLTHTDMELFNGEYKIKDLFDGSELELKRDQNLTVTINATGAKFFMLTQVVPTYDINDVDSNIL